MDPDNLILSETIEELPSANLTIHGASMSCTRVVAEVGSIGTFCFTLDTINAIKAVCDSLNIPCKYLNKCIYFHNSVAGYRVTCIISRQQESWYFEGIQVHMDTLSLG